MRPLVDLLAKMAIADIVSNARTIRAKVDSQNRIVGYVLAKMEEDTAAIGAKRLHECLNDGSGCHR